jgi:uncharacterized protein YbbK (DUF523 family)
MRPILVSACLLGLLTRYDGAAKRNEKVLEHLRENDLIPIPVCPEQLAGLPTPRPKTCFAAGDGAEILDGTGSVINSKGAEMNRFFTKGAAETLKVARIAGCAEALLKERSPSCGVRQIYRGEDIVAGQGVTTALLRRSGLTVFSEDDL